MQNHARNSSMASGLTADKRRRDCRFRLAAPSDWDIIPAMASALPPARRGRPRKFGEPSRVVALTLPEAVIEALRAVDDDLGRAVVRVMQPRLAERRHAAAEVSAYGDRAVILVPPSSTLTDRTGVELVPLSDGRALISFDQRLSVQEIELRVCDAVDDPALPAGDRAMFEALARILREARRSGSVALRERSIIVLQRTRGRGPTPPGKRARTTPARSRAS